jgi:hypothetical protein
MEWWTPRKWTRPCRRPLPENPFQAMEPWKDTLKPRFADGWIRLVDCEDGWRDLILGLVS